MSSSKDLNQYLVPTLEGFRNKLLDLTTRNNLLNLSLSSKRTAKLLRFIDCDPQAVLAALCDGTTIQIIPLPDPPDDDGKDEAGEEFEKALVIARKQDPLYQQVLADSANDQGLSPALVQAEDRLRSMLREEFGPKSKSGKSSKNLAQWAEAQGIPSTYELTIGEGGARSVKNGMRVLQLEASLERLAEGIRKQARSSIEETGNNILYLAFGCLEWSEKDRKYFAPLILLPVELSKAATRGGANTFYLRAADDVPIGNVTLKERLRRDFLVNLPLPELDENGFALQAYISQVADAISEREAWAVSNFLNLALFNFSGLGLYEDLDPEVVKQSVLVRQLLAAEISKEELPAEANVVAEDQHVDHPAIAERVPVLITQADASQFSGIADVMSGRSMVIEGPPGTGKSQTITNIIANALCAGQRVLFVAEKKVALDVVFTRLADAGLRPYCLRIASDKTNKREVYDELAQRLLLPKPQSPRRDAVVEDFQQLRGQLNSFSQLLNTGHGPEEESPQELFWRELLLRQQLQGTNVPLGDLRCVLNEATQYTRQQVDQITQSIEELARLCTRADLQLFRSTFVPLGTKPSDALSRDQLMDQAQHWHSALVSLSQHPSIGEAVVALTLQELRQWALGVSASAAKLPEPLSSDQEALLPVLASQEGAGIAQGLLTALKAEQGCTAKLSEIFTRIPDPLPDGHAFTVFSGEWNQWSLGEVKMPASAGERDQLNARFDALSELLERIQVIASTGSGDLDFLGLNHTELVALEALLGHLSALPAWVLEQRQLPLWQGNRQRYQDLIQNHLQLKAECQHLGLDRGQEPQSSGSAEQQEAADLLRQCCQGGLQPMLGRLDATKEWATQLEGAEALLLRVEGALSSPSLPMEFQGLRLEQLQGLPDVLRRLMALSPDALRLRGTDLWTTPPDVINAALEQEQELQQRQQVLARDGLRVSENLKADELRAAATKLETMSPLRKLVSRSYARASKLAAELGALEPAGKPEALRRVAEVLEMQANFPAALVRSWCSSGVNLAQATAVVKELAEVKGFVGSSSNTAGFLEQARTLTADELTSQIGLFEGGLSADLDELVCLPLWSGLAIASRTASDLRRELAVNQANLQQLERVNPYAVWARDAGIEQPEGMAEWLEKVIGYRQREAQFPTDEFEAGLGLLSSEPLKAQVVLDAAARNEELTNAGGLEAHSACLASLPKGELEQRQVLLSQQLLPGMVSVMGGSDLVPSGSERLPLRSLLETLASGIEQFRQLLAQFSAFGLQRDLGTAQLQEAPIELELYRRRQEEMLRALSEFRQQAGPDLADASPEALRGVLAWITSLKELLLPMAMEEQCLSAGSTAYITQQRAIGDQLTMLLSAEEEAADRFLGAAQFNPELHPATPAPAVEALGHLQLSGWLQQLVAMRESFPDWVRIHQLKEGLPSLAEQQLVDQLMGSGLVVELWEPVYRWNLVRSQLSQISEDVPEIRGLRASEQVARRERFHGVEDHVRELDRAEVIARIHRNPEELPDGINRGPRSEFTEMGLICNEAVKQKRHRPLRHLFQDAGNALRGLKPCWMMSPSTVASLVPREAIEQFDLVIVDEASQMAPERAFGVISRAKQCVVVGDPKQLPPTAFFQRTTSSEDAEQAVEVDTEALDEESILDLCTKSFHPVRRLKWHYRSRHGSLIAFSNRHFYNNELVVFPSCDRDFAISRHLVEAPRYTKGINLPEVKQVCDVVLQQLEEHPKRSLGVVAMNEAQSEEIAEQLEMLSIHHDELRRRLELTDSSEELFVKSLEKVQGDERDTIVISTTYGPSEPGGGVAMRFGPINQNGGHRRLNVLFTRAKCAIELVTSMESHQIQPTATSSQGVHALKGYLKYVESQSLDTGRQSGREPDSEFEIVVAEALTRHGYEVDCQVGVANYFIDLAIRHPDKPETYLLGVECDGATYHSARSARDRDKYRQAVLEGLGWQIYRIWSTDWFENAEAETRKLIAHIDVLLGGKS
ncbi:DUF4011 domain-containing protein [Cyanobium sp. ATX 6E8]|uniref:DUF4011 domain-containing protein n=1 Tax=Cyanobium sp. ATX 6E8 TaxID=2823701 RepID=UPI0020CCA320|nr:DUF4011 domain-containing protein [Cyanobium sp. ATX 6E8]MCP9943475.1 DUF4011 domain-containing protein [Cyanobium sp. ATX 6E8]